MLPNVDSKVLHENDRYKIDEKENTDEASLLSSSSKSSPLHVAKDEAEAVHCLLREFGYKQPEQDVVKFYNGGYSPTNAKPICFGKLRGWDIFRESSVDPQTQRYTLVAQSKQTKLWVVAFRHQQEGDDRDKRYTETVFPYEGARVKGVKGFDDKPPRIKSKSLIIPLASIRNYFQNKYHGWHDLAAEAKKHFVDKVSKFICEKDFHRESPSRVVFAGWSLGGYIAALLSTNKYDLESKMDVECSVPRYERTRSYCCCDAYSCCVWVN